MTEATNNALLIRSDIKDLVHRKEIIDSKDKCDSEKCLQRILTKKEFYLFPCKHKFHTDCLIELLKQYGIDEIRNEVLSNECPLCGELMIKSIHIPLVHPNEKDDSWNLMIGNKWDL